MNRISLDKQVQIITLLTEGNSIRGTARIVGCAINTVIRYLKLAGKASQELHDELVQGVKVNRMQVDEIWSFVKSKKAGESWTWVAMDTDTKLALHWHIGNRGMEDANVFMEGAASRIQNNPVIASDGLVHYIPATRQAFGEQAELGQLNKIYTTITKLPNGKLDRRKRYVKAERNPILGNPQHRDICTSHIERQNLTMRMGMRRFTRKTNAFSKKLQNHCAAVALHYLHYNFIRVHRSLKTTPAIAAGIIDYPLSIGHLVRLIQQIN